MRIYRLKDWGQFLFFFFYFMMIGQFRVREGMKDMGRDQERSSSWDSNSGRTQRNSIIYKSAHCSLCYHCWQLRVVHTKNVTVTITISASTPTDHIIVYYNSVGFWLAEFWKRWCVQVLLGLVFIFTSWQMRSSQFGWSKNAPFFLLSWLNDCTLSCLLQKTNEHYYVRRKRCDIASSV